jgi:hypothetical protein
MLKELHRSATSRQLPQRLYTTPAYMGSYLPLLSASHHAERLQNRLLLRSKWGAAVPSLGTSHVWSVRHSSGSNQWMMRTLFYHSSVACFLDHQCPE